MILLCRCRGGHVRRMSYAAGRMTYFGTVHSMNAIKSLILRTWTTTIFKMDDTKHQTETLLCFSFRHIRDREQKGRQTGSRHCYMHHECTAVACICCIWRGWKFPQKRAEKTRTCTNHGEKLLGGEEGGCLSASFEDSECKSRQEVGADIIKNWSVFALLLLSYASSSTLSTFFSVGERKWNKIIYIVYFVCEGNHDSQLLV